MIVKHPSARQKRAMAKIVENGGNISKGMRDAGYSPATAENPKKLTETIGWKMLLEQFVPDDRLSKALEEGLGANKQLAARVIFKKEAPTSQSAGELPLANSQTDDFIEVPDFAVRHKYLDTALRLKDKYPADKKDVTSNGETLEPTTIVIVEDKPQDND